MNVFIVIFGMIWFFSLSFLGFLDGMNKSFDIELIHNLQVASAVHERINKAFLGGRFMLGLRG